MPSAKAKIDYVKRHPERVAITMRDAQRRYRTRALELLGPMPPSCVKCGFGDIRALHIDHKNGGGNKNRDKNRSQNGRLKEVMADPSLFQILCANCNYIKRIENNEIKTGPRERVRP